MGQFVNPGNENFAKEISADIYVDKTGLISFTNHEMNTPSMFICSSRPRRFGKSYSADMLAAYYSKGCIPEQGLGTIRKASRSIPAILCLLESVMTKKQKRTAAG